MDKTWKSQILDKTVTNGDIFALHIQGHNPQALINGDAALTTDYYNNTREKETLIQSKSPIF